MKTYDIILPCNNGFTLCADGANLVVKRNKTTESYPIASIQSFAIKKPGFLEGSITFTTAQASTGSINIGYGVSAAIGAEKTFFFKRDDYDTAKDLAEYVTNYGKAGAAPSTPAPAASAAVPAGSVVSVVDEIRGLKQLLDEGILTEEEFAAKKKQLLGI